MAKATTTMFDPILVTDLFNKVRGKSTLAKLSNQEGIPFIGNKEFVFSMDKEIDIVAENGKYSEGGISFEPVKMVPIKFEYGARVSKEFLTASEEEKMQVLKEFNNGFAAKLAKGLDIAAMHGFNPRTNTASLVVGENHFDAKVTETVDYTAETADGNLDTAIRMVADHDGNATGIAMSRVLASDMAKIKENGATIYPAFKFGGVPADLNGIAVDANVTVSKGPTPHPDHAIVGDFENAFKWGFGKDITFEIIPYGDPDNTKVDLAGSGQVYLRSEAFLGWGILAPEYFVRVKATV